MLIRLIFRNSIVKPEKIGLAGRGQDQRVSPQRKVPGNGGGAGTVGSNNINLGVNVSYADIDLCHSPGRSRAG